MEKKKKEENKELDGNRVDILSIHNNLMHIVKEQKYQNQRSEDDTNLHYYLIHAIPILDRYRESLQKQVKVHFMGASMPSLSLEELNSIIREYLKLVRRYFPKEFYDQNLEEMEKYMVNSSTNNSNILKLTGKKQKCTSCHMENMTVANLDNYFICESCGYTYDSISNDISFKDIDRINISNKYQYDRRIHFKDCINQYQGKQNATIDSQVYKDLTEQFRLHHLIPENYKELPKLEAFKNVTKEHILMFLKETGYTKHYEDVVLIHYQLTDQPTPDISHLENDLLQDFDQLTDLYDKRYRNNERKNFINTQYVLFQLLKRHKYPCKKEDFNILKTIDRKYFHDSVMQDLFEIMGWNIHPLF